MKRNRLQSGQAFVEFAVLATTMMILVFGVLEIGRYLSLQLRMSSAVREAGRLIIANGLLPRDGTTVDYGLLQSQIGGLVFDEVKTMISPSGFDGTGASVEGIFYVSLLKRSDDGSSSDLDEVEITVERVFGYGNWFDPEGNPAPAPAAMYNQGDKFDANDSDRLIDPMALNVGERTVLIEIYHPLTFTNTIRKFLNNTGWNQIHEYAVF